MEPSGAEAWLRTQGKPAPHCLHSLRYVPPRDSSPDFGTTHLFRARFLNPQINLLCPKTKGSVLLGFAEGELVSRTLNRLYRLPERRTSGGPGAGGRERKAASKNLNNLMRKVRCQPKVKI